MENKFSTYPQPDPNAQRSKIASTSKGKGEGSVFVGKGIEMRQIWDFWTNVNSHSY